MKLACLLSACLIASAAQAAEPASVTIEKDLSQGVRLYGVDGQRMWPSQGSSIEVTPGLHTLQIRYAFDFQRDQNGGFVAKYDFECDFVEAGTYTLRSADSRPTERVPTLWIDADGHAAPRCRPLQATSASR